MNQDGVSSGFGIGLCPLQRFVLSPPGDQRLCAGDHQEVRHSLSRLGRFDLPAVLFDRNQLPADAGVKTAALRVYVVLDANGGDSGPLTVVDGAHDIQRIAVSGIAIGDDRDIHSLGDVALNLELFAGCDEAGVRNALERGRNGEAACPDTVEAGAFDQTGTQRVVSADNFKRSRSLERSSKLSSVMHSGHDAKAPHSLSMESFTGGASMWRHLSRDPVPSLLRCDWRAMDFRKR